MPYLGEHDIISQPAPSEVTALEAEVPEGVPSWPPQEICYTEHYDLGFFSFFVGCLEKRAVDKNN